MIKFWIARLRVWLHCFWYLHMPGYYQYHYEDSEKQHQCRVCRIECRFCHKLYWTHPTFWDKFQEDEKKAEQEMQQEAKKIHEVINDLASGRYPGATTQMGERKH